MQKHFMTSDLGELYDTRQIDWHKLPPLRPVYRYSYRATDTVAKFKATLRAGAFAWPGGYQMFLLTSDGSALCFDCARKEARQIMDSIANKSNDGWRVVACDINFEDSELQCDHCSKSIPASYGE